MNTKIFETVVTAVFCLCMVLFAGMLIGRRWLASVREAPVITVPEASVFSVSDGEEALYRDVSAYDREDGDISDRVVVESVSAFDRAMTRTVTYAVCDSDGSVTKTKRSISYSDYRPAEFSLKSRLCFTSAATANAVFSAVRVTDVLDGDLTPQIRIESYDEGESCDVLVLSAANSAGDISRVSLNISIVPTMNGLPQPELSEYIVYLQKGEDFDPASYLRRVTIGAEEVPALKNRVKIHSGADPQTPGSYTVTYEVTADSGVTGVSYMTVIVRE